MDQPLETTLSGTMALVDSCAQTDRTTTLTINANSQTTPINPTIINVSTQTNYRQATTAIQTQLPNNEGSCMLRSDQAAEVAAHKEGFEAGLQYGMTAERIVWNGYHGPDLCIWNQVQKMDGATQMELHLLMDSSAQTITQIQPLNDEHPHLTNPTPPVAVSLQPEFQSSCSALLHDEVFEPPEQQPTPPPLLIPEPTMHFNWAEDAKSIPIVSKPPP